MPASAALLTMAIGVNALAEEEAVLRDQALKVLGKHVFFDTALSMPKGNQACVSCHEPFAGGTSGFSDVNETTVAVPGATGGIGNRKPPTNTYASFSPPFQPTPSTECGSATSFCGGNFWDGRSQGHPPVTDGTQPTATAAPHLGAEVFYDIENAAILAFDQYRGPTSDQALNPMPNPVEQNISREDVCKTVQASTYSQLYELAWGQEINCSWETAYGTESYFDISFKRLMLAVGAYQHSDDINSFTSKRDIALRSELACDGESFPEHYNSSFCKKLEKSGKEPGTFPLLQLTDEENFGHDLFYGLSFTPGPGANCFICHSNGGFGDDGTELLQTYSDHGYHNIGTPLNPQIPNGPDTGLNRHTSTLDSADGFFKTPPIRNVAKGAKSNFTKAYTHNGYFKSVETIVHFYNTRDAKVRCETIPELEGVELTAEVALANDCWPAPEFPDTAAPFIIGNLGLTQEEEAALVAYIKTLEDQHTAKTPVLVKAKSFNASPIVYLFASENWSNEICELGASADGVQPVSVTTPKNCIQFNDLLDVLGESYWLK
ncbi:cytochrome-c peroxidase [Microbulbifer marinus]|uniref:cytochrome-c peroxidase n=1 Tax=Microbulbifer marinus TaxID=658218 RepID=UPI00147E4452|nr:cytochrome c peroxidase [Microbulbifer marinus]